MGPESVKLFLREPLVLLKNKRSTGSNFRWTFVS